MGVTATGCMHFSIVTGFASLIGIFMHHGFENNDWLCAAQSVYTN